MAQLVTLTLMVTGADAMSRSVGGLIAAIEGLVDDLASAFGERLMTLYEGGDLFVCETPRSAAVGATILDALKLEPTNRYLELFAAVAGQRDDGSVRIIHGWPVLSIGASAVTIAAPAEVSIPLPGAR